MTSRRTNRNLKAVTVAMRRLAHAEGLALPAYQSEGAAGLDLVAALPEGKPVRLVPRARGLIPTGLVLQLPAGTEAQIRPRSGLALKQGLTVLNSPGTIDSDYRGEVQVILVNLGSAAAVIRRGDRIAQMVIAPVSRARLEVTATVADTARGAGGFGSTGTAATAARAAPLAKRVARKQAMKPKANVVAKPAAPVAKRAVKKSMKTTARSGASTTVAGKVPGKGRRGL
jgi:dUTP pyrophosphatase